MPTYYMGLKYLPSSKAALIRNFYPLLVTFFAWYFLKEKITKYDIIATLGAFGGVVLMNINSTDSQNKNIKPGHTTLGIVL